MNIPWKFKSFVFGIIDFLDAPNILYFLQKYVSKRWKTGTLSKSPIWQAHKKYLKKYNTTGVVFEFGAGKTLAQNLFLSDIIERQVVVDLNPMIDLNLVEDLRRQISHQLNFRSEEPIESLPILEAYGIEYRAPYDAAVTDFSDKSIDACISTNTLEHIPEESIIAIFSELYRTLKDDGIISAKIDYSDHYAHTDESISWLNYLKYDKSEWKKYNHKCHFQNRLRHYNYLEIFERCGFEAVEKDLVFSENNIPSEINIAFQSADETWKATSAHIVLKKVRNNHG